jgi:hypothetical protein
LEKISCKQKAEPKSKSFEVDINLGKIQKAHLQSTGMEWKTSGVLN